jgi:hypothetical protein
MKAPAPRRFINTSLRARTMLAVVVDPRLFTLVVWNDDGDNWPYLKFKTLDSSSKVRPGVDSKPWAVNVVFGGNLFFGNS